MNQRTNPYRCVHCRKVRAQHRRDTLACPDGLRTPFGHTRWSATMFFKPETDDERQHAKAQDN